MDEFDELKELLLELDKEVRYITMILETYVIKKPMVSVGTQTE